MTIPHFGFNRMAKSYGNNIIATASYQSRRPMIDESETDLSKKRKKSFSTTKDHIETFMVLPAGTPERYNDPEYIWNTLNNIETDRLGIRFLLPMPKELSFEQCKELAILWVNEEFTKKGIPVQLSFHMEKDGNGNLHAHGLASYRQLINGKWAEHKSKKAYVDANGEPLEKVPTPKLKNGMLQYNDDGTIKTVMGWQTLIYDTSTGQPIFDSDGKPILKDIRTPLLNPDGTQRTTANGKYTKLAWRERKIQFSDLEKKTATADARKLWESCINKIFKKYNIRDNNGNLITVDLRSYAEQDANLPAEERRTPTKHIGIGPQADAIKQENALEMERRKHVDTIKRIEQQITDNVKIINDFVEQQKPVNAFVDYYTQPFKNTIAYKNAICDKAMLIAIHNHKSIENEIEKNKKIKSPSDRTIALQALLRANSTAWEKTISAIKQVRNTQYDITSIRQHYCNVWNRLNGWHRCRFLSERINKSLGTIYQAYLISNGMTNYDAPETVSLPTRITMETALKNVISGNSVPTIKSNFKGTVTAKQLTDRIANDLMTTWSKSYTPPKTSDFELLTLLATVPNRINQLIKKEKLTYKNLLPANYHPEQDMQAYNKRIQEIKLLELVALRAYRDETGRQGVPSESELQKIIVELKRNKRNFTRLCDKYGIDNNGIGNIPNTVHNNRANTPPNEHTR